MSDISCGEEFKQNVTGSSNSHCRHRNRKMYKPTRRNRNKKPFRAESFSGYIGTSGSDISMCESSMESIESYNNNIGARGKQSLKMTKISSADSLLSMIRNIASSKLSISSPSSPQLSDNGDLASSGFPTPLSTPDTPNGSFLSLHHAKPGSQIMVSVLSPHNTHKDSQDSSQSEQSNAADNQPTITLEVPSFNYGKCLSPIREMPSPLPTPCPSPLPTPAISRSDQSISDCSSSLSFGSSVSRSSSFRKHINKAKTVPQEMGSKEKSSSTKKHSIDSCSFDSGEGTIDFQDYCDEGVSDFSEISIPIPSFRSSSSSSVEVPMSKQSSIPIIMTSLYDSSENLCRPTLAESETKKSTRNKRLVKQRQIPPNIIIPQVSISCEDDSVSPPANKTPLSSNSSTSSSPMISPSGKIKKKPPPLVIPDSNFFNFPDDIQSAPVDVVCKPTKDSDSKEIEHETVKQTKSLDKNITLFKQHPVDTDEQSKVDERNPFLGGKRVVKQGNVELPDSPKLSKLAEKSSCPTVLIESTIKEVTQGNNLPELVVMTVEEETHKEQKRRYEKLKLKDVKKNSKSWQSVQLGSPPMKKFEQEFGYKPGQDKPLEDKKKMLKFEQPQSLDCEGLAPMIKITPMSDLESDSDSSMLHHLPVMDYLNPFCLQVPGSPHGHVTVSTCSSESNLSSSGYSSMTSPGGSRRGSYNRLCISESEDMSTPTAASKNFFGVQPNIGFIRRPSPLLKSPSCDSESSDQNQAVAATVSSKGVRLSARIDKRALFRQYRTDSETTDDQLVNIPHDHDEVVNVEPASKIMKVPELPKIQQPVFNLPEIVVDHCINLSEQDSLESTKSNSISNSLEDSQDDRGLSHQSGSSSRSESPSLSDKNSVISAHIGNLDSDSNIAEATAGPCQSKVRIGSVGSVSSVRKERKVYRKKLSRSNSPTSQYASDQGKESYPIQTSPKKSKLNKRRFRSQNKFEFRTSSSTESLGSTR